MRRREGSVLGLACAGAALLVPLFLTTAARGERTITVVEYEVVGAEKR